MSFYLSFARRSLSLALLALSACDGTRTTASATSSGPPAALQAAHEAYLGGDFAAVGERVHDVLLDPNAGELARENALELLDRSYEATHGKLPSRFAFPPGFSSMKVSALHGQNPYGEFRNFMLYVRVKDGTAARITDMTVRRLPDETLVDKASHRGELRVRHDEPGYEDVVLEATGIEALPADGVFSIRIAVDGAPVIDTWVIGRRLAASAAPEIASPAASSSISDERPTIRWTPFRSPELAPYESRTLSVYIHDESQKKAAFDQWIGTPGELDAVRVGDVAATGVPRLTPGPYWLALTAGEERMFGPITVTRSSQMGQRFHVVR